MERLLNRVLNYPRLTLFAILLLSVGLFISMRVHSRMETDLDEYMPQRHPAFVYSNQAEKWFDIKDGIIIAIEHPAGIYNPGTLQKVKDITKALQKMPEIKKADVTSLYTADNIVGTEDGLDVTAFFKKAPRQPEDLARLRQNVRGNEMVFERLVSSDETVTVLVAEIEDDLFSQEFYHRLLDLSAEYEGPEKLYVAGTPIVEGTLAFLGPKDMRRMVLIVLLVIVAVLYLAMRSVRNTFFTLMVVVLSTIWTFGSMAAFRIPIYSVTTMIPVMLIAIGVADGIHLYSHLELFLRRHPLATRREAVADMLRDMWKPVIMTSVTTAVGFVSLLTSEVYPIKYFGLFAALGVMIAMLFSLLLIPCALLVFGLPSRQKASQTAVSQRKPPAYALAEKLVRHKYVSLLLAALVIVVAIVGIPKIWINSSFLEKFDRESDIVFTDAFINAHFGGTNSINVVLESPTKNRFKQPDALRLIDQMQTDVEQLATVGNSFSLADYLKRMNKVMHADDDAFHSIPDSPELVAQYLLLYEMSGDPDNLWEVVDYNYRKANLTVQLKSDNSQDIKQTLDLLDAYIPQLKQVGIELHYAGSGYKALIFSDLIMEGQIKSLLMSLVIVILLLALMFKNMLIGLIGAIPITLTALFSFGIMGLLNIPLSSTTALVSSIAIGIGIDYAVHFIERYKINALETGDKAETVRLTMHHSGRAIIFNAVVVIAGFLVLLFSVFPPNRMLGALVSLNMFTSFLGTVTVMFLTLYFSNSYFRAPRATAPEKSQKALTDV